MAKERKIGRRPDRPGGHLMISVPERWVDDTESALQHLEEKANENVSTILRQLIISAAKRQGWKPRASRGDGLEQQRVAEAAT